MADVSETLQLLQKESVRNFNNAVRLQKQKLDRIVPVKTGKLARSQKVISSTNGNVLTADFIYPTNIANFTDAGTRPHIIRPKRASVLRFEVGGDIVFAKKVKHPGTRGTKWFSRTMTLANWQSELKRWFS